MPIGPKHRNSANLRTVCLHNRVASPILELERIGCCRSVRVTEFKAHSGNPPPDCEAPAAIEPPDLGIRELDGLPRLDEERRTFRSERSRIRLVTSNGIDVAVRLEFVSDINKRIPKQSRRPPSPIVERERVNTTVCVGKHHHRLGIRRRPRKEHHAISPVRAT